MTTSNNHDCFREFVGMRVKGVLFDALPCGRMDLAAGTKTLVFEDGRGLTVASNGSYWTDSAEDVNRAIESVSAKLRGTERLLREALELAGKK